MTDAELSTCRKIIHGHAAAAAAGNLVPVPGVGLATDTVTMTTMAMALASALGGSITESVAKTMAINAVIAAIKRQPIRIIAKEVSKIVPVVGQLVAPSVSVAMLESAGWLLANELVAEREKARSGDANSEHVFVHDRPFITHEEALAAAKNPKPDSDAPPSDGGHNFKYDKPFITHEDALAAAKNSKPDSDA